MMIAQILIEVQFEIFKYTQGFYLVDNLLAWSKAKRKNINENYLANPENKENKTTSFHNQNSCKKIIRFYFILFC